MGADGDFIGHHEGGVESHAELADDVGIVCVQVFILGLELQGTGLGNDAQVLLHVRFVHADAVVPHGDGTHILIHKDLDHVVIPLVGDILVRQRQVAQLVDGIGCVGDDLPEEDLLVGVDGVDHQVQQPFGFRFELFLCHTCHVLFELALFLYEC